MDKQPRVHEFIKFLKLLGETAPDNYVPWLIRLNPQGKDPIQSVSWKDPINGKLTISQAIDYMKHGGNIGLGAMTNDNLVHVDCDSLNISDSDLKNSLRIRSRSRIGRHAEYWCFETPKIPNIVTEDDGEVRSRGQYVVCAGSYVPVSPEELALIPDDDKINAGYYTVDNPIPPTSIVFEELPRIFKETYMLRHSGMKPKKTARATNFKLPEKHSALFDVTVFDIYKKLKKEDKLPYDSERWSSLFHDSTTSANMSITRDGLLHCWRHYCSFNSLQALVVLSGYMPCSRAGTPHDDNEDTPDCEMIGDNQAIWEAWRYAKKEGFIPVDDPIPSRAMAYIASKHLHFFAKDGEMLPRNIYNRVLKIVEEEY